MFKPDTYSARRQKLKEQIGSGIILFLGNNESPMNYEDNAYHFRQDSTFLYFWGLNSPGLAAIIDIDADSDIIFGHDFTIDEIIWMGPQPKLAERAEKVGVNKTAPLRELEPAVKKAKKTHFVPQYRADNIITLSDLLGIAPAKLNAAASVHLIKAIVAQRSIKSAEELAQIEIALDIAYDMHTYVMKNSRPGIVEQEIAGAIEGIAVSKGGVLAFPVIFSVNGQTLHTHDHGNTMKAGDIALCDAGAESAMNYAADITRITPVSGRFSDRQKSIYEIVLDAQLSSIGAIKPTVPFKDAHLLAAKKITSGLQSLGIMRGDIDEAVNAGAHALFFPHGLGHMMGLDVHDMESFGEDYIGYNDEVQRSEQFGLKSLRIGKKPQPGYVLTVEPGIYFIPELIDIWKADKKFADFINYDEVEKYRDFGGIRIEDNVVVTDDGCRVLGKPIPKAIAEVETMASG